jgi:preprotein translocase subunit SecY
VSQPIQAFQNAFKIPELKRRIIFAVSMLAVYRLGCFVPTPGVNGAALAEIIREKGGLLSFYNMFSGGAFEQATIFALGIMPYITASIIFSLLVAVVPALEKLQKQGAEGQKKITEYTRYATIGLCVFQSIGIAFLIRGLGQESATPIVQMQMFPFVMMCIISFTTGTAFIMWLGEQISEHGIGNGMSLIIFTSIVSSMPNAFFIIFKMIEARTLSVFTFLFLIVVMILVVAGAIVLTTAQRRIPVQYPRQVKGRKMYGGSRNYLPLRVNQAGVIPIIFATSILMLPGMVAGNIQSPWVARFMSYFNFDSVMFGVLEGILIIFFCFFYTAITFNPIEVADNLKKYGGVVMGVRPGKATAEYLNHVMTRVTTVGALALAAVALFPRVIVLYIGLDNWMVASFFGGTSLLILVGVALDTVKQIEQHLVMHHYDGFMKGRKLPGRRR